MIDKFNKRNFQSIILLLTIGYRELYFCAADLITLSTPSQHSGETAYMAPAVQYRYPFRQTFNYRKDSVASWRLADSAAGKLPR